MEGSGPGTSSTVGLQKKSTAAKQKHEEEDSAVRTVIQKQEGTAVRTVTQEEHTTVRTVTQEKEGTSAKL